MNEKWNAARAELLGAYLSEDNLSEKVLEREFRLGFRLQAGTTFTVSFDSCGATRIDFVMTNGEIDDITRQLAEQAAKPQIYPDPESGPL
ncbi:MAG: hypothetical protein ACKVP7_17260 [Hyphomicrobiaceae bacterium]